MRIAFGALLIIAAMVLVLFFHQGPSGNGLSRLMTVWAIVEDHTLRADRWAALTNDKAFVDGHYYGEKAPLSSLVVLPFYALYRLPAHAPQSYGDQVASWHQAVVIAGALPFGLFVFLLFRRLRSTGADPATAVWTAWLASFGSIAFNYGNAYFGHMLAATLLVASFELAAGAHAGWAGLLGGCAVATEYPLSVAICVLVVYVAVAHGPRRALRFLAGTSPAAVLVLAHNRLVTGHWLDFPYAHVIDLFKDMHQAFGFRLPNWNALWELTFSQYRGAFFYAPLLFLFVPLLVLSVDGDRLRRNAVLAMSAAHLVLVSSYFAWAGGWCTGPRHLVPVILLITYEGSVALIRSGRFRLFFLALAVAGLIVNLAAASTNPLPPFGEQRPMFDVFVPALTQAKLNTHHLIGELTGRSGLWVVAIWVVLFAATAALLAMVAKRFDGARDPLRSGIMGWC